MEGYRLIKNTRKPEDVVGALEKFKEHCKPAAVSDSLFIPPTDVKFTDYSSMMKQNIQAIPSGGSGGAMTEEQIKQLQQKYQQ